MPQAKNAKHQGCSSAKDFETICIETLRESGARITQPRKAVIRCLSEANSALSAREVFEALSKDASVSSVDQVSVYRILETLEDLDLVHQVFPSGGYLACFHSQCNALLHVLIRCSSCEFIKELDVPQETIAPTLRYLEKEQNFVPDTHVFQMNGICNSCNSA